MFMVSCHSGGVWERNYYPTSNFLPSLSRLPACSRRRRRSRYSTCIAFLKRNFFNALIFFLSLKYNNNRMTMRVRLSSRRQNCMYHRRIRIFPRAKQKEKKFIDVQLLAAALKPPPFLSSKDDQDSDRRLRR